MRLFWKIAAAVLCLFVIGGVAVTWYVYKAKAKLVEAAHACRVKAEQGDVNAEYDLGHMYNHGLGVTQDYAEAARWWRKAADQGNAIAQYDLGLAYQNGYGIPQNYNEAICWYRKAADQGYSKAQFNLGRMYYIGHDVPQNYAEAYRLFRMAADQGDSHAQFELGKMYYHGQEVPKDYAESARWYHKAADQNVASAQYNLGFMLWNGYGVTQDHIEAYRWFRKAADNGNEYAMRTLSKPLTTYTKFSLIIQMIGGIILLTNFLSLNIFEPGKSLRSLRQKIVSGTGVLMLFTTGLSWYGYTHYKIRCISCGLNSFTMSKWLLNMVVVGLLFYIVLSKEPEAQESEIAADESVKSSENNKEL
jgi:TPR repeat protein